MALAVVFGSRRPRPCKGGASRIVYREIGSQKMDERFRDRMRRERTDVILREAAGLASERGWVTLRVEDVARRAGIAKGTIYLDFKDKDELITAAIRRSMGELL